MKNKLTAGLLASLIVVVGGYEGYSEYTYTDPVGIPTICFGHTQTASEVTRRTRAECEGLLAEEIEEAHLAIERCVAVQLSDNEQIAYTSFTYNVGAANFCGSTLVKKLNSGDHIGACHELSRWVYARGVRLQGLANRRADELSICLNNLAN